ncbi:MAG: hypothetical protein Q4Q17_01155 [Tissierellia bacterium]|nr:hypothetical protein [Tissierellia bacterium]
MDKTNWTKSTDLIIPKIVGDMVSAKLDRRLKMLRVCDVDDSLVGVPGDKNLVGQYKYVGPAEEVGESDDLVMKKLEAKPVPMEIKEAGLMIPITDRARICAAEDPADEASKQIAKSITDKIDSDVKAAMLTTTRTSPWTGDITVDQLLAAVDMFAIEDDSKVEVYMHPSNLTALKKDAKDRYTRHGKDGISGYIDAEIAIVRTRSMDENTIVVVQLADETDEEATKPLKVHYKNEVLCEQGRDIAGRATYLTGSQIYGVQIWDENRVIKMTRV